MRNNCSELGDFCYQIELAHNYAIGVLGTPHCLGVGFFETMVWGNSLCEATERAKIKYEHENREGRKKGLQLHVVHERTRLIPKVHKKDMRLEEYRVWRERGKQMWHDSASQ